MTRKLTVTAGFQPSCEAVHLHVKEQPQNYHRWSNRYEGFGAVAILCIEMKLGVGNEEERLKAIAQVIAECDGRPDMLEGTFCC